MAPERPEFQHRPERHGLVGPFSGRQLVAVLGIVVAVAVILVAATRPLGTSRRRRPRRSARDGLSPRLTDDRPDARQPGARAGRDAGRRHAVGADRRRSGKPIRLADLRGKGVWINFWASWCAPCQAETPVLRDVYDRYKDRGLELIGISVQETNPADVGAYAAKYGLDYTIAADLSADAWRLYRGYGAADPRVHRPGWPDPDVHGRAVDRRPGRRPGRGDPAARAGLVAGPERERQPLAQAGSNA